MSTRLVNRSADLSRLRDEGYNLSVEAGYLVVRDIPYREPEGKTVRGVIAIHSSDDRYSDDVHYIGGCVSAMDMSQWATSMLDLMKPSFFTSSTLRCIIARSGRPLGSR